MIPKTCPLNNKYKLQTTLQNICAIKEYSKGAEDCKDCQYGKDAQLEREKEVMRERISRLREELEKELERKRKVEEFKRDMMKQQGIPTYYYDTERLSSER
jgi:hypothetical protein